MKRRGSGCPKMTELEAFREGGSVLEGAVRSSKEQCERQKGCGRETVLLRELQGSWVPGEIRFWLELERECAQKFRRGQRELQRA